MILSNRKLKLIITALLLTIFLYFVSIFDVKAYSITDFTSISDSYLTSTPTDNQSYSYNGNVSSWSWNLDYDMTNKGIVYQGGYDYIVFRLEDTLKVTYLDERSRDYYYYVGNQINYSQTDHYTNIPIYWFKYSIVTTDNKNFSCEMNQGYVLCPNVPIAHLYTYFYWSGGAVANMTYFNYSANLFRAYYFVNTTGTAQNNIDKNTADINNSINSSDIDTDSSNTEIDSWSSNLPTNNTISNLITMPITLVRAYLNGFNSSCSSFNLGSLMGTNLVLPCINLSQKLGSIWSIIDVLMSGFMIFAIAKRMIKVFNDLTSLKDNQVDSVFGGGN